MTNCVRNITLGQSAAFGAAPVVAPVPNKMGLSGLGLAEINRFGAVPSSPSKKRGLGEKLPPNQSPSKKQSLAPVSPSKRRTTSSPSKASTPQRLALAQIDRLEKEKAQLETRLQELHKQAEDAQQERERLIQDRRQSQALEQEIAQLKEQLGQQANLRHQLEATQKKLDDCQELEQRLAAVSRESEERLRIVRETEARLRDVNHEKEQLQKQNEALLQDLQQKFEAQSQELKDVQQDKGIMEEKLFYCQAIACKMNLANTGVLCNVQIQDLFDQARERQIPCSQWPLWIAQQLASATTPSVSIVSPRPTTTHPARSSRSSSTNSQAPQRRKK